MKKIIVILLASICLVNYVKASTPEYIDSGQKIGDQTIWYGYKLDSDENICIGSEDGEKKCIFSCYWCDIALFQDTDDMHMLPLNNKGILFQADEFQVAYYDLNTRETIQVDGDIYKFINQYKIPDSGYSLDDTHWAPFKDENFNEDKTKYALELNFYKPDDNEINDAMICILDIEKLINFEEGYFECPIVSDWLRRVETDEIESNLWKENEEYPKFEKWEDGKIEIETDENKYILDTDNNTLEEKPFNYTYLIVLMLLIGSGGLLIRRRKK